VTLKNAFEVKPHLFWVATAVVAVCLAGALIADMRPGGASALVWVDGPALALVAALGARASARKSDWNRLLTAVSFIVLADIIGSLICILSAPASDIEGSALMTLLVLSMLLGASGFFLVSCAPLVFGLSMVATLGAATALDRGPFLRGNCLYLVPAILGFIFVFYYSRRALEALIKGYREAEDKLRRQNLELEEASRALAGKNEELKALVEEARAARRVAEEVSRERELLLREIHHRVKNNLQIIVSMLNLQAEAKESEACRSCFFEATERVRSMAMVHEMLHDNGSLSSLDFPSYLRRLSASIVKPEVANAAIELKLEGCELGVDQAMPCGLIVAEALINALKYGRGEDGSARISVELASREEGIELLVADGGRGFPLERASSETKSGLSLMAALAEQVRGRIAFENKDGALVRLVLPAGGRAREPVAGR
jgi:two-component sensor histidine kinase